jgi:hypothetical protein
MFFFTAACFTMAQANSPRENWHVRPANAQYNVNVSVQYADFVWRTTNFGRTVIMVNIFIWEGSFIANYVDVVRDIAVFAALFSFL